MPDEIPVLQQREKIEIGSTPDFQSTYDRLAESENYLSVAGSKVADVASNTISSQLGAESGKNPHGNLLPPVTDFDKNFVKSYETQAKVTLGLKANKLITDSNLEVASAARITQDLIDNSQDKVTQGLNKIYEKAPTNIRNELESTFTAQQLSQREHLTRRMISEQHDDRRNNTILYNNTNAEIAHSLASTGNFKEAESLVKEISQINQSAVKGNIGFTPEQAKIGTDTVRRSYINGRLQYEYDSAEANKKGDKYLKGLSKKPDWISDADYPHAMQSIASYANQQKSLKSDYENLTIAEMNTKIAQDAGGISGIDFQSALDKLSPINAAKLRTSYINGIKSQQKSGTDQSLLSNNWSSSTIHANSDPKNINKVFNDKVDYAMKNNQGMSRDNAENQVAMSAGGPIPVLQKEFENKLTSANPQSIASASAQIQTLHDMEAGRVYSGLSQKAKAIAFQFQHQKGSMPDTDLARQITDNLTNIDEKKQKILDNIWGIKLSAKGAGGLGSTKSFSDFALEEVGLKKDKFGGKYFSTIYGNDIYDQLQSNFNAAGGDYETAVKMTKDYVSDHYGETAINGIRQTTDSPIEKYLGYKGHEAVPFIQQDLLNQLSESFKDSKLHNPNDYWETLPLKGKVAEVVRHTNGKEGKKDYRYPVNLVGRAGNQWDVVVQTPHGNRNLFLVAPNLGVTTYQPNKNEIDKNVRENSNKGWF